MFCLISTLYLEIFSVSIWAHAHVNEIYKFYDWFCLFSYRISTHSHTASSWCTHPSFFGKGITPASASSWCTQPSCIVLLPVCNALLLKRVAQCNLFWFPWSLLTRGELDLQNDVQRQADRKQRLFLHVRHTGQLPSQGNAADKEFTSLDRRSP